MEWLFLRGWSREARHWMQFPRIFEEQVRESKVHCLDLPGFGDSTYRDSPLQIEGIVSRLRAEWLKMKAQNQTSDWAILGISLGGMITAQWIIQYPDDFKNAVIINSSAANLSPLSHRLRWPSLFQLFHAGFQSSPQKREAKILSIVSNKYSEAPYDPGKISTLQVLKQLVAAVSFRLHSKSPIPCLFLSSDGDRLLQPEACRKMAETLDAELRVHSNAGHDLPLDDPQWCAEQVADWLHSQQRAKTQ